MENIKQHCEDRMYTDSLYFDVQQTAKYCKMLGLQFFAKIESLITSEEFVVLDVVSKTPDICQRDLAKILLRDRANTGRLLESLEKKELIQRIVDVKNNRLVKRILLTEKGLKTITETREIMYPIFDKISIQFTEEELSEAKRILKKMRDIYQEIVELKI